MARPPLPPPPLLDPAWYPDPTGRYEARYWDGRRWTSHISHYGATGADPLLRARFDHWWLRGLFRLVLWAAFAGALWWAYNEYWPTDERDLVADEEIAGSGVLAIGDLPEGWVRATAPLVSPLALTPDDEGTLSVAACQVFADDIEDSLDEPTRRQSFESPAGSQTVAHITIIGGDDDLAGSVLDTLRDPETGPCLTELWQAVPGPSGGTLTVGSTMAMTDPVLGDEAAWWRLTGTPAFGPQQVADVITLRVDRALVEFVFVGTAEAVAVDVQRGIINAQVTRLRSLLDDEPACDGDGDVGVDGAGTDDAGGDGDVGADGAGQAADGDGRDEPTAEPCPDPTATPPADTTTDTTAEPTTAPAVEPTAEPETGDGG